jgi:Myosin head (motor domain)
MHAVHCITSLHSQFFSQCCIHHHTARANPDAQRSKSALVAEIFDEEANAGRNAKASSIKADRDGNFTGGGGGGFGSPDRGGGNAGSPGGQLRKSKMATGNTLGKQFKTQLDVLMVTLNATDPHYIRCMKPNNEKRGGHFRSPMMLQQLRYSGLLEVCRIRKMGYPIRRTYAEFHARYKVIAPACKTIEALLSQLKQDRVVDDARLLKGKTKVLMKQAQANELDVAREEAMQNHVVRIQGVARGECVCVCAFVVRDFDISDAHSGCGFSGGAVTAVGLVCCCRLRRLFIAHALSPVMMLRLWSLVNAHRARALWRPASLNSSPSHCAT